MLALQTKGNTLYKLEDPDDPYGGQVDGNDDSRANRGHRRTVAPTARVNDDDEEAEEGSARSAVSNRVKRSQSEARVSSKHGRKHEDKVDKKMSVKQKDYDLVKISEPKRGNKSALK